MPKDEQDITRAICFEKKMVEKLPSVSIPLKNEALLVVVVGGGGWECVCVGGVGGTCSHVPLKYFSIFPCFPKSKC